MFNTELNSKLDNKDKEILEKCFTNRQNLKGPQVGDYILKGDKLHRFSHNWGESGLQTSPGGSFYLENSGYGDFSGGLDPTVPLDKIKETSTQKLGIFWFFHHGFPGQGCGVNVEIPCRVYELIT